MKENSDGNDTNVGSIGNSIEEDIAKVNTYIELVLEKDYCNCNELNTILGEHCDGSRNVAYAMQHILSAYRRVLKENEKLRVKWDKDTHILQNKLDYANADRIDLAQQNKGLRKENEELKEERQIVGIPVRNKRDRRIGIVLHQWESGSVAVLESINPRVINTHDSWNTLEIVTDEVKQTPPPEPQLPTKTICESFSKKVRNK